MRVAVRLTLDESEYLPGRWSPERPHLAAPKGQDLKLESLRQKDGGRTGSWRGPGRGTEGDCTAYAGEISQVEGTGGEVPTCLFLLLFLTFGHRNTILSEEQA